MPSDRPESQGEERLAHGDEERTIREPGGADLRATEDRGESVGDPDVLLDVPMLKVEELELEVEELRARVSYGAELADMVKINVGLDAEVRGAKIELQGVEVQAQLKARLDNVRAIFSEVLAALQSDPELAQNMLRSAGLVEEPGGAASRKPRVPAEDPVAGGTEGSADGPDETTSNDEPASLADLPIEEEYVDGRGRLVGRARDESGKVVEELLDQDGNLVGPDAPGGSDESEGQDGAEATDAARRRAEELGLDLSGVRGTGSGGRILVRDVEEAAGDGG